MIQLSGFFTLLNHFFTKVFFKGTILNKFLSELHVFSKEFVKAFKKKPLLILSFLYHDLMVWWGFRSLNHKGFYHVWSTPTILMTTKIPWFLTILWLGVNAFTYTLIFLLLYYTFNYIFYSTLAIIYLTYLLFIHFKELAINRENNIQYSWLLRIIYEFKLMNLNLAPLFALIQQIQICRSNSFLFVISGIFTILIINVIITSQSFINFIIKVEIIILEVKKKKHKTCF